MTKIHNMSIMFAAFGLKLTCDAILLSWFWPERAFIVFVFEITKTKTPKFTDKFDQNSVEGIWQKIIWQIRPILVTIWLHIPTDSILGALSFRNLEK